MAYPLPDKPSIAVLPFANMSDDPKQEYFSDGIAEDLITDLSKISGLFVIARNSTFSYKGKPIKIRQVAEELGVRYVLEGSVRKADEKVRITAQLIDVTTGGHLWANRYDGQLSDVFALQDKITQKIVSALAVKLTTIEKGHVGGRDTHNMEAYDVFLRGLDHIRRYTPDDFAQAIFFFKKAIELDPSYWRAYAMLAWTYWESLHNIWFASLGVSEQDAHLWAEEYLQKAMNKPNAIVHQIASKMHADRFEHDEAIAQAQRSISLDPNDENSYLAMAYVLIRAGRPKDALDFVKKAMRLDPHYPPYYLYVLGLAHFGMEDFEEAATSFQRAFRRNPEFLLPLLYLVAAYAYLGRQQEAGTAIEELNKIIPGFNLHWVSGGTS